jgi:hypothetical protein
LVGIIVVDLEGVMVYLREERASRRRLADVVAA